MQELKGDYKAAFAEVEEELGVVGVIPQSEVWERIQALTPLPRSAIALANALATWTTSACSRLTWMKDSRM